MAHYAATELVLRPTGGRIDIYVAAATGSDTAAGTIAAPLATYAEAVRRLKYWSLISPGTLNSQGAVIHLASGTYQVTEILGSFMMDGPIFVIGDGAGQAGDDGFTVLASGTAQAGSGSSVLVSSGGLTLNQRRGKTIQMTSGAASGDRRTCRDNTTVNYTPSAQFSAAVANGDTYRIVEPAVIFEFELSLSTPVTTTDYTPLARNCSAGLPQPLNLDTFAFTPPPGVYFCNLRFQTKTGAASTVGIVGVVGSTALFFGVELIAATSKTLRLVVDTTSVLLAGIDEYTAAATSLAVRPFEQGFAANRRSWQGWGVSGVGGAGTVAYKSLINFIGYCALANIVALEGGNWRMMGGSIITTASGCLQAGRFSRVIVNPGNGTPVSLLRLELNTAGTATVDAFAGADVELTGATVEKQDQGFCLAAEASGAGGGALPGRIGLNASVSLTGVNVNTAPTGAMTVIGGYIDTPSTPTITGFTTGTQLSVRSGSNLPGTVQQQCDLADLAAAGNVLPTLPDRIFFLANGLLTGFVDAAAAGTFDSAAMFDGLREISRFSLIDTIRMTQVIDGGAGTTTVEIFRRRAGVSTSLGTIAIAQGGGAFATNTLTPASVALRTLNAGDFLVVQFNGRQTTTAANVTVEFLGAGIDGRFGWIRRA